MSKLGGTCDCTTVFANMFNWMIDTMEGWHLLIQGPERYSSADGSTECRQSLAALQRCIAVKAKACYMATHLWWAGRLGDGDPRCKCGL